MSGYVNPNRFKGDVNENVTYFYGGGEFDMLYFRQNRFSASFIQAIQT